MRIPITTRTALAVAGAVLAAPLLATPAAAHTAQPSCELALLPEPDGKDASLAFTIDSTGTHAGGRVYHDGGNPELRIWTGDEIDDPKLSGADTHLQGVNSSGVAVGVRPGDGDDHFIPWIYDGGEVVDLDGYGDGGAFARAINDSGDVVGAVEDGPFFPVRPVKWVGGTGQPVDLPLPEGAERGEAFDIDAAGTVVGYYVDAEGVRHPYRWDADGTGAELPVPEGQDPATFSLDARDVAGDWIIGFAEKADYPVIWRPGAQHAERLDLDFAKGVNPEGWVVGDKGGHAVLVTEAGTTRLPGMTDHNGSNWETANAISDAGVIAGQVVDAQDVYHGAVWNCS